MRQPRIGYHHLADLWCAHVMGDTYIAWGVGFPAKIIRSRCVGPASGPAPCGMDGIWRRAASKRTEKP